MNDVILVINSGSSSVKFALYPLIDENSAPLVSGKLAGIGRKPILTARHEQARIDVSGPLAEIPANATHEQLITQLLEWLELSFPTLRPVAAGHRVVHGGRNFTLPTIVDASVREILESFVSLAPLHQPHNLAAIDTIKKITPDLAQIACFDTAFHRTQPRIAQLFALPRALTDEGIIRYGFHGLSYEYIADTLPKLLGPTANGRVIVAHLGNGASMCAMQGCRSVATSMGFTALDGLVMGRRCGSIDAGIVLHLLQEKGLTPDQVAHLLYRQSGLLGVSGISNNMRDLEASPDPNAREAIDLFCYRAAREIGSLAATLKGIDALVFTAGIGENSALVRRLICEQSSWLGIDLDSAANDANECNISSNKSKLSVCVVPTNEEAMIASSTRKIIGKS